MANNDNPEGLKISNKFIVGKFIAGGSFGKLHLGKNIKTGEEVAIKLESNAVPEAQLPLEYNFYKMLGNGQRGIPKVHYFGPCGSWHALIMDLLGPNLEKMLEKCGGKFTLKTTVQLAIQFMALFEYFHGRRLIYRDTKPENFLLGVTGSDKYNVVHIIDLGLCKEYKDEKGVHIQFVEGKCITGTARYMSLNNHLGKEQSRRDDMEAVGYMMVYLFKGELPWQGVDAESPKEKFKKIANIKRQIKSEILCADMPEEFTNYMNSVRALEFEEEPKYKKFTEMFTKLLLKSGFKNDGIYDWDKNHKPRRKSRL